MKSIFRSVVLALCAAPVCAQEPWIPNEDSTICFLGGATAERMQHHGWLETRLQLRFPDHQLRFRNLGFAADELSIRQRTMNFGKFADDGAAMTLKNEDYVVWDRFLERCEADVLFAFFGYNESFAGEAGLDEFRADLQDFVQHIRRSRYNGTSSPELVLFGPSAHENTGDSNLPDGAAHNERLRLYSEAMREVAAVNEVRFVELMDPMLRRFAESESPLTLNGVHLLDAGNAVLAEVIEDGLCGEAGALDASRAERVREGVLEKNLLWFNRYRATDGYNVYGERSRRVYEGFSNFDVLQREMDYLDVQVANRDRELWTLAQGGKPERDDSNLPELIRVPTNKRGEGEDGLHLFLAGERASRSVQPAEGLRLELFADERRFPQLVNPVQMAWDTRGRLWVACWPTYPHWTPDQEMNDRILILEDRDGDGEADSCKEFAGNLHNPTGLEFWNGGVLVGMAPDLVFLRDEDGDDRADSMERLIHGLSSADTHHGANSFVLGPDGALYFQEGIFHHSQVESIYGPVRNNNGCVWRFEPRTFRVERYIPYNFANPHGHVFDRWGQGFMADGTGNQNYYALPFSGHLDFPDKHSSYFTIWPQRTRPCGGTEILSSAHFAPELQGNLLIANVIGFRGILQLQFEDEGSGFQAHEVEPLVEGSDLNFRPVDIEIGPDGAAYFLDWHNPLIGHLQHHLRDPSRDRRHGRIYRVTDPSRPLLEPMKIAGEPIEALLENLKSPNDRERYRTRIELSGRDSEEVCAAAGKWWRGLQQDDQDYEHHLLEALWLHQQHNRVDEALLDTVLRAQDPRARAAATRILRTSRHLIDDALDRLAFMAADSHPRVRLEAVVAASFFEDSEAATAALSVLSRPMDRSLDYALNETVRALKPYWQASLETNKPVAAANPEGLRYLLSRVPTEDLLRLPPALSNLENPLEVPHRAAVLETILTRSGISIEERRRVGDLWHFDVMSPPGNPYFNAVRALDGSLEAGVAQTTRDLVRLLIFDLQGPGLSRQDIESLTTADWQTRTRAAGYAALLAYDRSAKRVFDQVGNDGDALSLLLRGISMAGPRLEKVIDGDKLFEQLAQLARMDSRFPTSSDTSGNGLEVRCYVPNPPTALREEFANREPVAVVLATNVGLDLGPVRDANTFGLHLRGRLRIDRVGAYTFYLSSDDGSRLYVNDEDILDNDGPHSMSMRSATIELLPGLHDVEVTFFESGGAEGLELEWSGPGIERSAIPDDRWSVPGVSSIRSDALDAIAALEARFAQKESLAVELMGNAELFHACVRLLDSVPETDRDPEVALATADAVASHLEGIDPGARLRGDNRRALDVARANTDLLSGTRHQVLHARLEKLGGTTVTLRTLPHQMRYDLGEFWVEAGKPVSLTFENNDVMPHNVVFTVAGAMAAVGEAAESLGASGASTNYVPDREDVLWFTELVLPGASTTLEFTAPDTPSDLPFVCTYPGHWRVMNGVMHVVETVDPDQRVARSTPSKTVTRTFVRDWTVEELEALFEPGWDENRWRVCGRTLFDQAGCIKCHTMNGEGSSGGPDLSAIGEKYKGVDLLRHIVEPSKETLEGYEFKIFELASGGRVTGRVLQENERELEVLPALLEPEVTTWVDKDDIDEEWLSKLSPMPSGLLVTLEAEEILDLVAYVQNPKLEEPRNPWLEYVGTEGPGLGKHIVLLGGDEEYRSEEALPMLARVLAKHHGFRCTVLLAQDAETGIINPNEQTHIPGMHLLGEADMLVCFLRFRELPDEDMRHFVEYVESGKPILGIRTATHAFNYKRNPSSPYAHYHWRSETWPGGFGQQILGETWINHHGHHGSQSTRGIIEPSSAAHPILRGVTDVWGPTDVYGVIHLPDSATVLLRGQVLAGMEPDSQPVDGPQNEPMMPLVWTRRLESEKGPAQRIIGSTIGAATDCESEGLRRVFVNACYWGLGMEDAIDPERSVDPVTSYTPTPFGFNTFREGVHLDELR